MHDVAIQNLPVRFAIDRAGLVGADGADARGRVRHRLSHLPAEHDGDGGGGRGRPRPYGRDRSRPRFGPDRACAIRAARASASTCRSRASLLPIGKGRVVREGSRIAILSLGTRLGEALKAADELAARGLSTTVADARFAKPLDRELILKLAATHKLLITIEEGAAGGFGAHVLTLLSEAGALENGLKVRTMTLPDKFQDHDKPERMYAAAGLDAKGIVAKAIAALGDVERLASSRSA